MPKIKKIYNLAKPSKYTDKQGETKTKWYNVGSMKEYDNGRIFVNIYHMENDLVAFEQKGYTDQDKEKINEEKIKI